MAPQCDRISQLRLLIAAELANAGQLRQAQGILTAPGPKSHPKELDLLARIAVQQSEFDIARNLWLLALEKEPHNQQYSDALTGLDALLRQPADRSNHYAMAAIVLLLLVTAGMFLWLYLLQ
jgi:hypothetical protein